MPIHAWKPVFAVAILLALGVGPASAASAAGPPIAGASSNCGKITLKTASFGNLKVTIRQQRTTCATAKRVARRYHNAPKSRCVGNSCYVEWKDGWSCASTNGTVWQQTGEMFSCHKGRATTKGSAPYPG